MADEDSKMEDFEPRSYQEQLMNIAKNQNTIIYLPTGSGKTYIAVMLIKEMSGALEGTLRQGAKRTFFLVNTVQLVKQQAAYIKRHVHYSVGEYSGDMNVDYWTKEIWDSELENHQIIVMTCQILLNILQHGYFYLRDINLLIFDECHHAVDDHPMRVIMQQFEHCERELQPRILGLTATLLNRNCMPDKVAEVVYKLETTFLGTVATCENMPVVDKYSAKPDEKVVSYDDDKGQLGESTLKKGLEILQEAIDFVSGIELNVDCGEPNNMQSPNIKLMNSSQGKANKKLKNLLLDVQVHINMLGMFGGSLACLAHTIQFERLRKKAEDTLTKTVFTVLITTLTAIRKLYEDAMSDCSTKERIHAYSSPKMLKLIEVLKRGMPSASPEETESFGELQDFTSADLDKILRMQNTKKNQQKPCCIIFVERRFSAKVVATVLKDLAREDENFGHIVPDFIVGFNCNPFNDTREGALEKKWNMDCIKKFRAGDSNVLVASNVLEEGIDVQNCNLVIKFDLPKDYRSYIQSKGRARRRNSLYYILVSEREKNLFIAKHVQYMATEKALQNLLVGRTQDRAEPSEEDIESELYNQELPPYETQYSKVGLASAISLVNRYCSKLPQDIFTQLTALWYLETIGMKKYCVHLQLPMNSRYRDIIKGVPMSTKKMAKRAVALETCRYLHLMGELDDHLLPRDYESFALDCKELFPLYNDDDSALSPKVGSKKRIKRYMKQFSTTLSHCRPEGGMEAYLHVIEQKPVYERPDEANHRKLTFYQLLEKSEGFAILSAKPMPEICDFPIYMNVGELDVHVVVNAACVQLTEEDVQKVQQFNFMLFKQLLKLMKNFMMVDKSNLENSYFIVPTKKGADGKHEIDWEVIQKHPNLPEVETPKTGSLQNLKVTNEVFEHAVIAPWYRGMMPDQSYIVTRVCYTLTPCSPFPSEEFGSYEDYFHRKYKLNILNKNQPMLEVKAISNKINCIRPRSTKVTNVTSKRKRQELQEDFEENLVPELCVRFEFPSVLWLKATCLPTILYRISQILLAEELRQTINSDLGIGCKTLPPDVVWDPVCVDRHCTQDVQSSPQHVSNLTSGITKLRVMEKPDMLKFSYFDWGEEKEPIDIDRHMEEVTLVEVLNYDDFISKPLFISTGSSPVRQMKNSTGCTTRSMPPVKSDFVLHKPIAILDTSSDGVGPQLFEVVQALTSASANDIFSLERLETLGDSFLKLMSSLYLFLHYPNVNEGKLTNVKGKIIGNRNLYYSGLHRNLGGLMKVHDFVPLSDWIPPSICVCRTVQQLIRNLELSPNILYDMIVPPDEQLSGAFEKETFNEIMHKLETADADSNVHSSMENFLSTQTVNDKTIADGVEALIGTYLRGSGVRGALKLLGWFKILPEDKVDPRLLLDIPPPTARLSNHDMHVHLEGAQELETRLQYTFRDRSYLLQALTHASYTANRVTDCYQRLEFLGDAVLDFLITCHIYESCGKLNPGELTDLRSALVNNVTFASLAVRNGFHKFLKYSSPKLMDVVDRFVKFQEERHHIINEEVLILLEENETRVSEAVEVPKVLGDIFESIAGAIYLDSGLDLQVVWRVFYRLMHQEISDFSKNVPKQPVRLLYELHTSPAPRFLPTKLIDEYIIMVAVEVIIDGKKQFFCGFGETKLQAKRAAAKHALKHIMK